MIVSKVFLPDKADRMRYAMKKKCDVRRNLKKAEKRLCGNIDLDEIKPDTR